MIRTWSLQDGRQSLVMASELDRLPVVVYWGPSLPKTEKLKGLAAASLSDVTGGMLDQNPELSICPEASQAFPGQSGLKISSIDGTQLLPKFRFEAATEQENRLVFSYRDQKHRLTYRATYSINPETHMITARSEISSEQPIILHWLAAPVFPAPQLSKETIEFSGRWCGEFQLNTTPWLTGARLRENRTGRTGHEHFPGLIIPSPGAGNTHGQVYGFHYGWSGGHRMITEELPDGRRQVQFGNADHIEPKPGKKFHSADLYATYSDTGINGCATSFQRHLRDEIINFPKSDRPRPVHYNCWEAVYFDHNLTELKEIATRAAVLGADRFVLDDGWFGKRDDDKSALGDWDIDKRKYPDGLEPLIDHVHAEGMKFGLWFEPEMISPDSDLYRAHPEWALGDADQLLGRQQMVLNMELPEVQELLFTQIGNILSEHAIDYIKWDHNRVLPAPDANQTRSTYKLLDRLREAFPDVEIESCASGGGRIDFGILERTHRVWLSDSNDALERLRIQHNAAIFLPSVITGSHVGPRQCHTSGRTVDIRMRAWVAAQRHMGFEMDLRELTEDEEKVLIRTTRWWKDNRNWMEQADILRLDSSDPSVIAEQQLSKDGKRLVVFAGKADTSAQILPRPLQLTRLDPSATYRMQLVNREDATRLSRGNPALKSGPLELSGQYLMHHGLTLPWHFPLSMWVIEGTRI